MSLFISTLFWHPGGSRHVQRTAKAVSGDLARLGIKAGMITVDRLRLYPAAQYQSVLGIARDLQGQGKVIERLKVDAVKALPAIELTKLPPDMIAAGCVDGILDLRGLRGKMTDFSLLRLAGPAGNITRPSTTKDGLIDFMTNEDRHLRRISEAADATVDKVFRSLDHATGILRQLGFHNIVIYRPVEGTPGKWQLTYATRSTGESIYDPDKGGSFPEPASSTVGYVIERGKKNECYVVDIYDPLSFTAAGLPYFQDKAEYDRAMTVGSGQTIFLLVESPYGKEMVIQLHNRRCRDERGEVLPPPLPEDPSEAARVLQLLQLYFSVQVVGALERVRERTPAIETDPLMSLPPASPSATAPVELTRENKRRLLFRGEARLIQGQRVRLFENPGKKFRDDKIGVVNWLRDMILSVYEGTSIAAGKTRAELIKALSLDDRGTLERTIHPDYIALLEGNTGHEEDLLGLISFDLMELKSAGRDISVLKVPGSMIKKEARGHKTQVALTLEIGRRQLLKYWFDKGLFKGFGRALTHGIPIYATTQSKRVLKDMLRLADLSIKRTAAGDELTGEHRDVIREASGGKADKRGLETDAYGGRIAIDEEERGVVVFGGKREEALDRLLAELGPNGRLHVVGYLNLWVGLKVTVELFFSRLFGRRRRH
ncbi:MAG: hypothetical protein MUC35_01460 [Candidatus Margulisbacteria bacterium]|jgi:hypothetical protein|nr:hypothetical protein [Candidatus Margulisiibacteriota bacterium]